LATNPQLAKSAAAGFPWGRLWFLLGALVVYRIGAHIPVPGIDPVQLAALFKSQEGGILGMFNMFSVVLALHSVCAGYHAVHLGLDHHATGVDRFAADGSVEKEGEAGRRKITQYTRYFTVVLATFQALGIAVAWSRRQAWCWIQAMHSVS
jgi:preprotein translocase subunit SecY